MSNQILQQLEKKIDLAIENIELMRLQIEELETTNESLSQENKLLKEKQVSWENNLHSMLEKLNNVDNENDPQYSSSTQSVAMEATDSELSS